jgi:hypothetical protein
MTPIVALLAATAVVLAALSAVAGVALVSIGDDVPVGSTSVYTMLARR